MRSYLSRSQLGNKDAEQPSVAILMCTFNGQDFLRAQLDSIKNQTYENWSLWISDDGSTDDTLTIIEQWSRENGCQKVRVVTGPKQGFCQNFLSLTANKAIDAQLFLWSDQDDVWLPEKISRAVESFSSTGETNRPILYGGRSILVNSNNVEYGLSPLHNSRPPSMRNALLQSIAGGNTMAFNGLARDLIAQGVGSRVPSHDWWAYLVICGCGGQVIYDPQPMIRYRQHDLNLVGSNLGFAAKLKRLRALLDRHLKIWTTENLKALERVYNQLEPDSAQLVDDFKLLKETTSLFIRWRLIKKTGIYRFFPIYDAAMKMAILMGRL